MGNEALPLACIRSRLNDNYISYARDGGDGVLIFLPKKIPFLYRRFTAFQLSITISIIKSKYSVSLGTWELVSLVSLAFGNCQWYRP